MKIRIVSGLLMLFVLNSCAQKNNESYMNTIADRAYEAIPKHAKQPMYGLQVDKMGCRMSVMINGEPSGEYFEKGGYSATETINGNIITSGTQEIRITVYPREGMQYIDDLANVELSLFYVKHKGDPMDTYQTLKTVTLPKGLKDKKLASYEMKISFDAQVPWDHSGFYSRLSDLRKLPDIEKRVLLTYENIRNMIANNELEKYLSFKLQHAQMEFEAFYMTKEEVREYVKWTGGDATALLNKKVFPLTNYEIAFENDGKKVFLVDKTKKGGVIKIEYGKIITEGEFKGERNDSRLMSPALVIPKGKTEFESL